MKLHWRIVIILALAVLYYEIQISKLKATISNYRSYMAYTHQLKDSIGFNCVRCNWHNVQYLYTDSLLKKQIQ